MIRERREGRRYRSLEGSAAYRRAADLVVGSAAHRRAADQHVIKREYIKWLKKFVFKK